MDTRKNEWAQLSYIEPRKILLSLHELQDLLSHTDLDPKIKEFRTNEFRMYREGWDIAVFCEGMSQVLSTPILLSLYERSDYDAVTMFKEAGDSIYCPIQMKELVPPEIDPHTTLNQELQKLSKYHTSHDTTFVFFINRVVNWDLSEIIIPNVDIAALWIFGARDPERKRWYIAGDLLNNPEIYYFDYPIKK